MIKVSFISGVCVKYDAISTAIRDEIGWMSSAGFDVRLFTYACDWDSCRPKIVSGVSDVLLDPHFQSSDLIIYHFGIHYPLFDSLLARPINSKAIVIFHNITPKALLPEKDHETIDRSFEQVSSLAFADHIGCDSQTNLDLLRSLGIRTDARVLSLAVHSELTPPREKPSRKDGVTRLMFIGRFVRSKGITELLAGLETAAERSPDQPLRLDMVGNVDFSDPKVVEEVKAISDTINAKFGNRVHVLLHGSVSDERKIELLSNADIFVLPTYHEGFCVPIIEAISAGCRVIAYDNSNVPAISGGFGRLVETGNVKALSEAIEETHADIQSTAWKTAGYAEYCLDTQHYISRFSSDATSRRFLKCITELLR
ncbi:MAG: glycosyltransferase [Hyphomonas sp.]|jgi:glycosyltransferase involved in cell wall biosynthesis